MTTYKTFKRSANSFEELVRARKITVSTRLSYEEARSDCEHFNNNRTAAQIRKGLKLEFTQE